MFSLTYLVKILHQLAYSFLSITLSCNDFLYKLTKDLIVTWFFSFCFLFLLYLFMMTSNNTLLPIDKAQAVVFDIGFINKSIPVRFKLIELDVVALITKVWNDFNIVVIVLNFFYFFLDLLFLSLKYEIICSMLLIWLLKLLTSFIFFSNLCSRSMFSNGAEGFNLSVFWSLYIV